MILHPLLQKISNVRQLLSIIFPEGLRIPKIFGHPTLESGAKRRLNGTSKVNTWTNRQTDTHTDKLTYRKHLSRGPMLWKSNVNYCTFMIRVIQFGTSYIRYGGKTREGWLQTLHQLAPSLCKKNVVKLDTWQLTQRSWGPWRLQGSTLRREYPKKV